MKTKEELTAFKEELNALKEEVETLNAKLAELTEEDLALVAGGLSYDENGFTFEVGDSYEYTYGNRSYRLRLQNRYTVKSFDTSVYVRVFELIGDSVTPLYFAEIAAAGLFLMTPVGRYAEDGKTKIE